MLVEKVFDHTEVIRTICQGLRFKEQPGYRDLLWEVSWSRHDGMIVLPFGPTCEAPDLVSTSAHGFVKHVVTLMQDSSDFAC